jgi:hypothetical protein
MDLKNYFKKVRAVESTIPTSYVVIGSQETSDGGKTGVYTEVSKGLAARMIVEGRGWLASEEESASFLEASAEARREAEALAAAQQMRFTLVQPAVPPADSRSRPVRGLKD